MSAIVRRFASGRTWRLQLARYLTIGSFVFVVDVGLFRLLVGARMPLVVAATIAYGIAICTHFTLNKFANFRAHDRPIHEQASTYAVVAFICWIVTLAVIELGVALVGLTPLVSKIIAVAINVPIGFLGHRFFTFGPGIAARLRQLFSH